MALAQSTEILLLDEPTTYLDLNHQLEVLRLAERLQRAGTTVVAVLHDLHLAFRYATHLVFMKDGQILAQGEPARWSRLSLWSAYSQCPVASSRIRRRGLLSSSRVVDRRCLSQHLKC